MEALKFGQQKDINSRVEGKTILITGATDGIGLASAKELARLGANIIVHGRNPTKIKAAVIAIEDGKNLGRVDAVLADFADLSQVNQMAVEVADRFPRLDVLLNNAGALFFRRQLGPDGYELTLTVNHLSSYLLTRKLLPILKQTAAEHGEARVVVVASTAHNGSIIDFDDLHTKRTYGFGMQAYRRSKLCNMLFVTQLKRRLEGSAVTINSLHPGFIASNIAANNGIVIKWALRTLGPLFALSPNEGARTSIFLASSPQVRGISGRYFVNCRQAQPDPTAQDDQVAARLWKVSEELVSRYLG